MRNYENHMLARCRSRVRHLSPMKNFFGATTSGHFKHRLERQPDSSNRPQKILILLEFYCYESKPPAAESTAACVYQQAHGVIAYTFFPRSGRVQDWTLSRQWNTRQHWTVGAPQRTNTGMLKCRNLCFLKFGSVNWRIWCKMWSGPKGKSGS